MKFFVSEEKRGAAPAEITGRSPLSPRAKIKPG
jgi:hypothetical protein